MSDTNRYPANPLDPAAQFAEWRRDIERRLAAVEGVPLVGSQLTGKDTTGATRSVVGNLGDGYYGVATYDANGNELFRTDERGLRAPSIPIPFQPFNTPTGFNVLTTSTTYDSGAIGFYATVPSVLHDAIWGFGVSISCPVGTTGELRVRAASSIVGNQTSQKTTSALACGSGSTTSSSLRWLHGLDFPALSIQVLIEARRLSGSGSVTIYQPQGLAFTGSDDDYSTSGWL